MCIGVESCVMCVHMLGAQMLVYDIQFNNPFLLKQIKANYFFKSHN